MRLTTRLRDALLQKRVAVHATLGLPCSHTRQSYTAAALVYCICDTAWPLHAFWWFDPDCGYLPSLLLQGPAVPASLA